MPFQFRFAPVLRFRRHRRDQARAALAESLQRRQHLIEQIEQLGADRSESFDQASSLMQAGRISIESIANRRYFAAQMAAEIARTQTTLGQAEQEVEACRAALVKADAEVKALERLREKDQAEFERQELQVADREATDRWNLTHRSSGSEDDLS